LSGEEICFNNAAIDLKTAKNEKTSIDSRISKLQAEKKKALEEKAKLEREKKQVAQEQEAENKAYNDLLDQISEAEENLRINMIALEEAEKEYSRQRELFKTRLKVMYQNSSTSKLETLLESKSLVDFYERIQYMSIISRNDSEIVNDLNAAKLDVEYKRQKMKEAKEVLEQRAAEKQKRLTSLKASRSALEEELQRSTKELTQLEKDIDKQIAESKRLNSIIKQLSQSTKKYAGGSMTWPCPSSYNITSYYGTRKHPILRKYKMHTGIDIGAAAGSSIVAANSGTVIMSQYDRSGGYGNMVVIDHGGGITTLYAHASKLLVKVGDEVKVGQVIAKVGSTGLSTGPHLHFEVRVNGVTKNPLSGYLKN
jgi:murein DD-endopeptidase MepM/ murein hydrolase activator NlpD